MGIKNEHKSLEQLEQEVVDASRRITLGATYSHYKGADKIYKVLHFATLEETNELCVVYEALYTDGLKFVRPVSVWLETVEWKGKAVPRFAIIKT